MGDVVRLRLTEARRTPAAEPLWREVIGRQLREERTIRGERIIDVAARAGVSPQYLSELERGRKDASSELLSAVAGALETTVLDLTRGAAAHLARSTVQPSGPVCLAA
ncbi:helix-turn-helix transcriptional regulator [Lapillicoccus sp.]|uniref:helix-turn-helix domain-containing protein n=1 Tax=Lapillicoccus sp. TaxID=1909287 RepID=UPI0032671D7E